MTARAHVLQAVFERALGLQRAGDSDGALEQYGVFLEAARQFEVPARTYAEVNKKRRRTHAR